MKCVVRDPDRGVYEDNCPIRILTKRGSFSVKALFSASCPEFVWLVSFSCADDVWPDCECVCGCVCVIVCVCVYERALCVRVCV